MRNNTNANGLWEIVTDKARHSLYEYRPYPLFPAASVDAVRASRPQLQDDDNEARHSLYIVGLGFPIPNVDAIRASHYEVCPRTLHILHLQLPQLKTPSSPSSTPLAMTLVPKAPTTGTQAKWQELKSFPDNIRATLVFRFYFPFCLQG